jgi:hypothetical protein
MHDIIHKLVDPNPIDRFMPGVTANECARR